MYNQYNIDQDILYKTCKYGNYYNPASSHYGVSSNVMCDRCRKDNLDICIGYMTHDLCMMCAQKINDEMKDNSEKIIHTPWCVTGEIQDKIIDDLHLIWNKQNHATQPYDPIAPYGRDSEGRIRTHWCITGEMNRKKIGSDLDMYFRSPLPVNK